MGIQKTSENSGHWHFAYTGENGGSTSEKSGHSHSIISDYTGELIMEPAGKDGHTHELVDYTPRPKSLVPDIDEQEKVKNVHSLYLKAKEDERVCRKKGEESYKFRYGDPWSEEDKKSLDVNRRAHLAVDEIGALVELLVGFQQQNRTDIYFKPVERGDEAVAQLLNALIKNILDGNNYIFEESRAFEDMVVVGRGFFRVGMSYDRNIEGDVVIEWVRWDKPVLGPHDKIDATDLEYMVLSDEFSKDKLDRMYPDKAGQISEWMKGPESEADSQGNQPVKGLTYDVEQATGSSEGYAIGSGENREKLMNYASKEIKVFECWRKIFYRVPVFINKEDGYAEEFNGASESDIKSIKSIDGVSVIYKTAHKMRQTKVAGSVLISDEIADLDGDANDFPLIVSYAQKYKEKFQGKVEVMKDAAKEIDKRRSQLADYLNAAIGSLFVERNSMEPSELKTFKQNCTNPQHVAIVEDLGRMPRRTEPVRIPVEFIQADALSSEKLRDIANLRDVAGATGANTSGRALLIQRRTALVGNDYLFDHLNLAKKRMAKQIVALIQEHYTPERIARLVMSQREQMDPQEINMNFTERQIIQLLENKDLTRLDVVIDESPHSKTMQDLTFQMLAELRSQGVGDIDTMTIVDVSPVPFTTKTKIKQGIMQMRQAAMQAEQAKHQTEIAKSMPDEAKLAMNRGQSMGKNPNFRGGME